VNLLKFPVVQIHKGLARGGEAFGNSVSRPDGFKSRPHPGGYAGMLHITGNRNHNAIGLIQTMEKFFNQIGIKPDDIFGTAKNRAS
jgi:hypothetical protein